MKYKIERIKKLILQEVMSILTAHTLTDPRIPEFITITRLSLSKDLHYCHLYFSTLNKDTNISNAIQGLNSASGFIQKIIAEKLSLKYTPKIEFRFDENEQKAFEVDNLLYKLSEKEEKPEEKIKSNEE